MPFTNSSFKPIQTNINLSNSGATIPGGPVNGQNNTLYVRNVTVNNQLAAINLSLHEKKNNIVIINNNQLTNNGAKHLEDIDQNDRTEDLRDEKDTNNLINTNKLTDVNTNESISSSDEHGSSMCLPELKQQMVLAGSTEMSKEKENIFVKSDLLTDVRKHECNGSHQAMVECQVCRLFCHADCVSGVGGVKMCRVCARKEAELEMAEEGEESKELSGVKDHETDSGYSNFTSGTGSEVFLS